MLHPPPPYQSSEVALIPVAKCSLEWSCNKVIHFCIILYHLMKPGHRLMSGNWGGSWTGCTVRVLHVWRNFAWTPAVIKWYWLSLYLSRALIRCRTVLLFCSSGLRLAVIYVCHFCAFVRSVGWSFLHPSDVVNDVTVTKSTHFKFHSQLICAVLQETKVIDCWCAVCYRTRVTLIPYVQNMVCGLFTMQMINLRTFCTFSSSVGNIFQSAHLIVLLILSLQCLWCICYCRKQILTELW